MIDGVFFDCFNFAYQLPTPWNRRAVNIPNCTTAGGSGCEALLEGTIDLARKVALALNAKGKVRARPLHRARPMLRAVHWCLRSGPSSCAPEAGAHVLQPRHVRQRRESADLAQREPPTGRARRHAVPIQLRVCAAVPMSGRAVPPVPPRCRHVADRSTAPPDHATT